MSASSSTTKTLPLVPLAEAVGLVISSGIYRGPCGGPGYRQFQTEAGAAIQPVGNFNRAAMLLNNTVGHRQAESRSFVRALGGEKRIVDAAQMFGGDPMARIGHFHLHAGSVPPGAHFQGASARHGVAGIEEEVQEYLLQFAGVAVDGRQAGIQVALDLNSGLLQLVL